MASCKECLYGDVCFTVLDSMQCQHFKDRSRFVELPCKVGDSYFEIAQRCTEKGWYDEPHRTYLSDCEFCDADEPCDKEYFIEEHRFTKLSSIALFMERAAHFVKNNVFLTKEQAEQALKEREGE